ncbi:uncharacterized protein BDV14DRAFT_196908 [Aspergillus stella-maris]|uniref:uncharacterized protein n=1 Tax=Aspergillus stella-maris TaxID=1810926 RepID=UPI003CCE3FAA
MKLSLSILVPLFIATGFAAPLPEMNQQNKPMPRQFSGGSLPEALSNVGGISGLLGQAKLPLVGGGGSK